MSGKRDSRKRLKPALGRLSGKVTARFLVWGLPPWWAWPMNSQPVRTEMTREILTRCRIERIVETGTFFGNTTEFFAQTGLPVLTVEVVPEWAERARGRLARWKNVDQRVGKSVDVLAELARADIDHDRPTLFYLDAHWKEYLPLREEAQLAIGAFPKAVLMIDDFEVPDDPGYKFDDYGPGRRLDLAYLQSVGLPPLSIFFPSTSSEQEGGARRGCVVVTADPALAGVLETIPLLRRWKS